MLSKIVDSAMAVMAFCAPSMMKLGQAPPASDITSWIGQYGAPAALVVYFVIRDGKREDRMSAALSDMEKFQRTTMQQSLDNAAIGMNKLSEVIEHMADKVSQCPMAQGAGGKAGSDTHGK